MPKKVIQETPIDVVINPRGRALRSEKRVWNKGDGRMRLYTVGSGDAVLRSVYKDPEEVEVLASMDEMKGLFARMPLF